MIEKKNPAKEFAIVVLSLEVTSPDDFVAVLDKIKPTKVPHFAGEVRIAFGADAEKVIDWLDEGEDDEGPQ